MSTTTIKRARSYWNWAVLIGLVFTWNALPFILHEYKLDITNPAQLTFSALIAVLAYLLFKGDIRRRIDWLFLLPFICIAVRIIRLVISVSLATLSQQAVYMGYTKTYILSCLLRGKLFESFFLLLSYFLTIGLCVTVTAGIRRWRCEQPA